MGLIEKFPGEAKPFKLQDWQDHFRLIAFAVIFVHLGVSLLIPFFIHSTVQHGDWAGLNFSVWYTKNYLFPEIAGWNPFFFSGFPQNKFYPPLVVYTATILSFFMPIEISLKIITAIAMLATPISFYHFARSFGLSREQGGAAMLLMYSALFILSGYGSGGDMHSTFSIGLLTHAAAIPLFFFYAGSLKKSFDGGGFLKSSVLLALIILTHSITALVSLLLLASFLLPKHGRGDIILAGKHLGLAFLLSAFWLLPALSAISYTTVFRAGLFQNSLPALVAALAFLSYAIVHRKKQAAPLAVFLAALMMLVSVGQLAGMPLHYYRFTMFFYLPIPVIYISLFSNERKLLLAASLLVMLVSVSVFTNINPEGEPLLGIEKFTSGIDGRVIVLASSLGQFRAHEMEQRIPLENNVNSVAGLYIESSENTRPIFGLELEMQRGDHPDWFRRIDEELVDSIPENKFEEIVKEQMRVFGINYAVASRQVFDSWVPVQKVASVPTKGIDVMGVTEYFLFRTGNTGVFEVLDYRPEKAGGNWEGEVLEWFFSEKILEGVIVDSQVPEFAGTGREKITVLEQSPGMDYIKLRVDSETPVPVLAKISYFPNWKAYVNGSETRIYRASPSHMLVYGSGTIEFRFERTAIEYLGIALSALVVAAIAISLAWKGERQPEA